MKHLKLFENFNDIDSICEKFGIENYTINPDGSIDVQGNVDLSDMGLTKLPLRFGNVSGGFYCGNNQLISLEGGPQRVGGVFYCGYNKLISLEGGPGEVGGDFNCDDNQLITLEGSPGVVGRHFNCSYNQLISLEGSPQRVGGVFSCSYNQLITLEDALTGQASGTYHVTIGMASK